MDVSNENSDEINVTKSKNEPKITIRRRSVMMETQTSSSNQQNENPTPIQITEIGLCLYKCFLYFAADPTHRYETRRRVVRPSDKLQTPPVKTRKERRGAADIFFSCVLLLVYFNLKSFQQT